MTGFDSTRDALSQGIVAAILVGVFALLAADRVHRVLIPIGAVAIVWLISYFSPFKLISFEAAKEAVDLNVILLLFSMMALVGVLKTTNVFPWAGRPPARTLARQPQQGGPTHHLVHRRAVGDPGQRHHRDLHLSDGVGDGAAAQDQRLAFFLPMVMAANIGGTATLIGDPPNVLIGADPRTGLSFMDFIYHLTVPCTFMMFVLVWYCRRYYSKDIGQERRRRSR